MVILKVSSVCRPHRGTCVNIMLTQDEIQDKILDEVFLKLLNGTVRKVQLSSVNGNIFRWCLIKMFGKNHL